eukprot:sb/3464192/
MNRMITTKREPCPDRTARLLADRTREISLVTELCPLTTDTPASRITRRVRKQPPVRNTRSTQQNIPTPPVSEDEPESPSDEGDSSSDADWQITESRNKRRAARIEEEEGEEGSREDGSNEEETPVKPPRPPRNSMSSFVKSSSESGEGESSNQEEEDDKEGNSSSGVSEKEPETPTPIRKRRRLKKRIEILDEDEDEEETPGKTKSRENGRRILELLKKSKVKRPAKHSTPSSCKREKRKSVPFPTEPSSWVTQIVPVRSPYLPQVSDLIYYFVQGHKEYLASEHCHKDVREERKPWEDRDGSTVRAVERCKVLSVRFSTGPPTLCQVFKKHYEDSLSRKWMKGDKFRSLIDEVWWEGTVLAMGPFDDKHYLGSPWKRIVVQWDTEPARERLSAWDIEPLARDSRSNKRRSPTKKRAEEEGGSSARSFHFGSGGESTDSPIDPFIMGYYHSFGNWGEETREEFTERFGTGVLEVRERSRVFFFVPHLI